MIIGVTHLYKPLWLVVIGGGGGKAKGGFLGKTKGIRTYFAVATIFELPSVIHH